MSHAQYLRDLLRPLGVYDLTAPFNGGELDAQGEAVCLTVVFMNPEYF